MTLIEVTLVTAIVLGLTGVTFIGFNAYKEGSDRASCIQNVANVQKALRVHCNLNDITPGSQISGLKKKLIGPDRFIPIDPVCPGGGVYLFPSDGKLNSDLESAPETVPQVGTVFIKCTISDHAPVSTTGW